MIMNHDYDDNYIINGMRDYDDSERIMMVMMVIPAV